jgi:photosynthetic reaction center cytochrome c subunit
VNLLTKASLSLAAALAAAGTVAAFEPTLTYQLGHPGAGMEQVETHERLEERVAYNAVPPALPAASQEGVLAVNAYKNVRVLGHVTSGEFTRLMTAMTLWVSPNQGCAYCHAPQRDAAGQIVKNEDGYPIADVNNMHSDELYTKVVARRMIQMTQRINGDWKAHVQATGVTCYTCHHGNPVPLNIWFDQPEAPSDERAVGYKAGQNSPASLAGLASLPGNSMRPFLAGEENIRVLSTEAIGSENRASIKEGEWTYGLMMHMSKALGVNCTYCHNTRSMGAWAASPATRATAWYGIRMVRELNREYLEPLTTWFPPERLGPTGDGPKANCATCHAGAYKPLLGVSMLKDYQILAEAKPQPPKTAAPAANSAFVGGYGGAGGAPLGGRDPVGGAGGAPRFEPPGEPEPPKQLPSALPSASTPGFNEAAPPSRPH